MESQAYSVLDVAVEHIRPSSTNPRSRTADEKSLAELVDSVRRHGILQPVLVRRVAADDSPEVPFEIVCAHRRHAAAKAAGLRVIPATVRELSDVEALEVQVIENLQRENLHPLEEAEGYERLTKLHGYTVEDLAAKLGKSRAYVYQRLSLTKLPKPVREIFWGHEMSVSLALLIARIPDEKLQLEAAEKIMQGRFMGLDTRNGKQEYAPLTLSEARGLIEDEYMLEMKAAPFDILDAQLLPAAGPCSTCPKRTGNVPDLFGDLGKGKDLCTDPGCFAQKRTAAWEQASSAAQERGAKVLSFSQSAKVLRDTTHGRPFDGDPWIHPGMLATTPRAGGQTWEQVLAKVGATPREYVARHPKTGKPVTVWKRSDVITALAGKGATVSPDAKPEPTSGYDWALENAVRDRSFRSMCRALAATALKLSPQTLLDRALESMLEGWADSGDIASCLKDVGADEKAKPLSLKREQRNALTILLALSEHFASCEKSWGIRVADHDKKARAEILAERKAAEAAKATAPAKSAKPAAKKTTAKSKGGKK